MSIRFFAEKHIPKSVTEALKLRSIDVIRAEDVGLSHSDDEGIMAFAVSEGRILLTHDSDFVRIHHLYLRRGTTHYGIMYVVPALQGVVGEVVKHLVFWYEAVEAGAATPERDLNNQLIIVS